MHSQRPGNNAIGEQKCLVADRTADSGGLVAAFLFRGSELYSANMRALGAVANSSMHSML